MRLTRKTNIGYLEEPIGDGEIYTHEQKLTNIDNIIQKLGQLEDVEEELGIDLRVYHKLMGMLYCGEPNILYVKDKDAVIQVGILEIDYCKKKIIFYKDKNYNDDYIYGFSQYSKTWALTKEELL